MDGKSWVDETELSEINRTPSPGTRQNEQLLVLMFGNTYVILIGHYHAPEEHYHYAIAVNVYSHTQSLCFTNRSHFYQKECSKYVKRVSAHQK